MRSQYRNSQEGDTELNITAFLNLMVILVPFLLITAVFSQMTVLELMLPDADPQEGRDEVKLSLQLVIREQHLDIQDANLGVIQRIDRTTAENEWRVFGRALMEIKSRFPDEQDIALLLEPHTSYQTMIRVMDAVRSIDVAEAGSVATYELFPNISIGDAPPEQDAPPTRLEATAVNGEGASS